MSQLDQIQITFVPGEDRLLMRVSTQAQAEFRFWLTRRFVRALRPAFGDALAARPAIRTQVNPVAQRELLSFERERAVQAADFKTPYRAASKALPLGEAPVLLTRFQLRPQPDGGVVLAVGPDQGNGVDLALTPELVHSLSKLLETALESAGWDLAPRADAVAEQPSEAGSTSLN